MAASRVKKKLGRQKVGNQGWSTKAKPTTPKPFVIARATTGYGWLVKQGKNWRRCREVSLLAPAIGNGAGEFVGVGVVTRDGGTIRITG